MKTVSITGPHQAAIVEQPEPSAQDDIVKVRLSVVPMCTEFKGYAAGDHSDRLGHEASGVVVDAGLSRRVHVGDRVVVMPQYGCGTCRYCTSGDHIYCSDQRDVLAETGSAYGTATFAEFMIKPDWLLIPVPADISLRHAAMACCALGPSFNAVNAMGLSAMDTLLVIGCGPVGLGAVVNGVARGTRVAAVDVNHHRLKLAEQLGAAITVDPSSSTAVGEIRALTKGEGVDAVFDSTGAPEAVELLEQLVHPRSRAAFVVLGKSVKLQKLVNRGLEVRGCWHWNHQRDTPQMLELIRRSGPQLDKLVTHTFALDEVEDAFRVQLSGACGKVLLFPFGEQN